MRRVVACGAVATAAMFFATPPVGASAPSIITTTVDVSFTDGYYTGLCGFQVDFFNHGTLRSTLFINATGEIVAEIDTTQGDRVGWEAPASGKVIAFPNSATLHTAYPNGTNPGSPATVTGSGLTGKIPGLPADAGQAVFAGHVAFIDAAGVPIVAFDSFVSGTGRSNDPVAFDTAVCADLSP